MGHLNNSKVTASGYKMEGTGKLHSRLQYTKLIRKARKANNSLLISSKHCLRIGKKGQFSHHLEHLFDNHDIVIYNMRNYF